MNILCIGDVIGSVGIAYVHKHLPAIKRLKGIDVVIANGENSADTNGIRKPEYSCDTPRQLPPKSARRRQLCH